MTLIYRTKTNWLFAILLFTLALPFSVSAQDSISLSVSPTIFEMTASPGQVWKSNLRIINNNPFELTVYTQVNNFRPLGENGASQFIPLSESEEGVPTLAEWIDVPGTAIVIPAEQTAQIPLEITLPLEVPPGGHYAAVLVGTRPPADRTDKSQVETAQVVSSLIFLRVAGDIIEEGQIRSFRTLDKIVEVPKADFELRFQNTGNVHLRPEGQITIYNMWGQERGRVPINRQTLFGNVIRDSTRSFNFSWEGEWSPVDIGLYRAEATLAYGQDGRKSAISETSFWIIPWRALLGVLLVLIVIGILLSWLIKLYVRRMLTIAGLDESNPLQKQLAAEKHRHVSVVAPIEAGILDLRSRFSNRDNSKADALLSFIVEYKIFFLGVLIIVIIIYVVSWFVSSVGENDRAFEVKISGGGQELVVDSESLEYKQQQTFEEVTKRDIPPVILINRSGINGAAANVALALEELGYTIDSVSTDLNQSVEQTVIVYDPALSDEALELSTVLDNALLSSFADEESDTLFITVYVGSDIAN